MRQLCVLLVAFGMLSGQARAQEVLAEQVALPYSVPMAEGLFRIHSAEALGKKGFSLRYLNEAYKIEVGKVGLGTSITGHTGIGYGLSNGVDLTVSLPLMLDLAGGLTKYGTGDVTTALKFGFPARFPSAFYWGFDVAVTHPLGYKGREALNVRPYGRSTREISSRMMLDLNLQAIGFRFNMGYLAQSGIRQTGLMYGGGVEVGRGQIFTMTGEYWKEPNTTGGHTERAVLGAHMNLWWLRLEAGLEKGLSKDLPNVSAMAGIQIHRTLGGKEKKFFGGRVRRVPQVKDTETTIRVAVVNFSGFESQKAGEHLAELIKMNLNRFGHIRLVEVGTGAEYLDPDAAMRLAQMSNADVVITGRVLRYEINRTSRPNLPLVVGFPQTVATVEADVRVVDPRGQKEPLSLRILGTGRNARGVHLFPTSTDDRTSYLSVIERERIWDEAGQQVVGDLLTEMSQTFKWLPQ